MPVIRGLGIFARRHEAGVFDPDGLVRFEHGSSYRTASPFPHLVIDGLFRAEILMDVLREWPAGQRETLETHDDGTFVKKKTGTSWQTHFGPRTKELFAALAEPHFLKLLERVTGMWGLLPDPYMIGGGLHSTEPGGRLAVHADFNRHPIFKLQRRLNLLIYLNQQWGEADGGWLELWDREMKHCERRVLPVFNRSVLFSTTSTSFHGQPEIIAGTTTRKSIALYYFSNGRADEGEMPDASDEHSTLWQRRAEAGY